VVGGGATFGRGVGGTGQLVSRQRHAVAQCERDRALLGWLARFRFVTSELAGDRFGVSRQRAAVRLGRLVEAGHVERHTAGPASQQLFSLTHRGAAAIEQPARRAPRTDANREHELALVWLATRLERDTQAVVLTEREIRQREAAGLRRYSVRVLRAGHPPARRWPDLVIEHADRRRTAIELERAAKGTARLRRIADAYATDPAYDEVRFIATTASVAARLAKVTDAATLRLPAELMKHHHATTLIVEPWPGASAAEQHWIAGAIRAERVS
jgi:hypothetical protein